MSMSPCEPELRESSSGWLASSPPEYPYRIGVVGGSPDEARDLFQDALDAWGELHSRVVTTDRG
jgi:hypothetical protein